MWYIEDMWKSLTYLVEFQHVTEIFHPLRSNPVFRKIECGECLSSMKSWFREDIWGPSTYLVSCQRITQMFRSFGSNTVDYKRQYGKCLWRKKVWWIEDMWGIVDLRDLISTHQQDTLPRQHRYCCFSDSVQLVSAIDENVIDVRYARGRRVTWLDFNTSRRCFTPSSQILLHPRFNTVSVLHAWKCDKTEDMRWSSIYSVAFQRITNMFSPIIANFVCVKVECSECLSWMKMEQIKYMCGSSRYLIRGQHITKMLRSFDPNTVVIKTDCGECLWWTKIWFMQNTRGSPSYVINFQRISKMFHPVMPNTVFP